MSSAQKPTLSSEQYLDRERAANYRSEYYRGEMFAKAGASWEHTLIKDNLARETGSQLRNGPCRTVTSDLRVKVSATGLYTYPDILVVCDQPQFEDGVMDTLLNPKIIVEVLSESTEKYDRGTKFGHYRQIASVHEYLLVAQDRPLVEQYVRQADHTWVLTIFDQSNCTLKFASINVQVALDEIYRGVGFPETPGR
ncbi:MAG: Uma2 family endonuclease [Pirellulaceae bacterium]|nr:Uma2 family endonuclease [Pirellulaceae bacterium]